MKLLVGYFAFLAAAAMIGALVEASDLAETPAPVPVEAVGATE